LTPKGNYKTGWEDPGFDLRGRGLCQQGDGASRKSLKVLKVEEEVILSVFWPYFY